MAAVRKTDSDENFHFITKKKNLIQSWYYCVQNDQMTFASVNMLNKLKSCFHPEIFFFILKMT